MNGIVNAATDTILEETSTLSYPRELTSQTTIRFQDCDPFGHLNNARYIDYFLNARVDHVKDAYDLNLVDPNTQFNWVVIQTQVAYFLPAVLGEVVTIQPRMLNSSRRTTLIEAVMFDEHQTVAKAIGWQMFMHVDVTTGRPAIHSDDLQTLFNQIQISDSTDDWNFDERVRTLRHTNKAVVS